MIPQKLRRFVFFEILLRKFGKLVQLNLIFLIPTIVALVLMAVIFLFPTHYVLQLPSGDGVVQIDAWVLYAVPLP